MALPMRFGKKNLGREKRRTTDFALIQLLIILCIILVLAVICITIFKAYRERGHILHGYVYDARAGEVVNLRGFPYKIGWTAFSAPREMHIDDTDEANLLVSLSEGVGDLFKLLPPHHTRSGEEVLVARRMQAKLEGIDFIIKATGPEIQAIVPNSRTRWVWLIKPKKLGKLPLTLTLSALLTIENQSTPKVLKVYKKTVFVRVSFFEKVWMFSQENLSWLWAPFAGLVGAILFFVNRKRSKKGTPKSQKIGSSLKWKRKRRKPLRKK